tara:strand:- start:1995 stop:2168 length:174 start_codon:yes stop_codon:yes gene_type:complete
MSNVVELHKQPTQSELLISAIKELEDLMECLDDTPEKAITETALSNLYQLQERDGAA